MRPVFLSKNVSYEDFIEMLELLCCFGKNVVNKAIKMKKYSHILQHMWPLRAFFQELRPAGPFYLQYAAHRTFLIANAAREMI
jgi:hypothetical protein